MRCCVREIEIRETNIEKIRGQPAGGGVLHRSPQPAQTLVLVRSNFSWKWIGRLVSADTGKLSILHTKLIKTLDSQRSTGNMGKISPPASGEKLNLKIAASGDRWFFSAGGERKRWNAGGGANTGSVLDKKCKQHANRFKLLSFEFS